MDVSVHLLHFFPVYTGVDGKAGETEKGHGIVVSHIRAGMSSVIASQVLTYFDVQLLRRLSFHAALVLG